MKQIRPMSANATPKNKLEELYLDPNYIGERKFDGSRYALQIADDGIFFTSRKESVKGGMVDKTKNVPQIVEEMKKLPVGTILDGEVDVRENVRNFKFVQSVMGSLPERALQLQEAKEKLVYKVFDILEFAGENLRDKTLLERRSILEQHISKDKFCYLVLVEQFINKKELYNEEISRGQEGIMLKNLQSIYVEDKSPCKTWYKVKAHETYDGVVLGYKFGTLGSKYEKDLGTLTVHQYVDGQLIHVSDVGGLTVQERKEFKERLDRGEKFIVEFDAYGKFEDTHRYRHPSFVRERTDKNEKDCKY